MTIIGPLKKTLEDFYWFAFTGQENLIASFDEDIH